MQFGDYGSFLELAFAVNLLWAVWGDLRKRLADRFGYPKLKEQVAAALDDDSPKAVENLRNSAGTVRNWLAKAGLFASMSAVLAVGLALFFVAPKTEVDAVGQAFIFLAMLPIPIFAVLMWLANHWFTWRIKRKVSEAVIDRSDPDDLDAKASRVQREIGNRSSAPPPVRGESALQRGGMRGQDTRLPRALGSREGHRQ